MSAGDRHSVRHDHHSAELDTRLRIAPAAAVELPGEDAGLMYAARALRTAIVAPAAYDGELALRLTVELDPPGLDPDSIAFLFPFKPGGEAAIIGLSVEIERSVVELLRLTAIAHGVEAQDAAELARKHARRARLEGRRLAEAETARQAANVPTCEFCRRRVALIHEGTRLCMRHAEELGVRPHGKIGDEL